MFAVVGQWPVDGAMDSAQLTHIVDVVRQQAGFQRGYWGQVADGRDVAHAFIVFDTQARAADMAGGVRAAIPTASLGVIEILAEA